MTSILNVLSVAGFFYYKNGIYVLFFINFMICAVLFPTLFIFAKYLRMKKVEGVSYKSKEGAIIISLTIAILVITALGANSFTSQEYLNRYQYDIKLEPYEINASFFYYIYLSAPIDTNGKVSEILTHFKYVEGNGSFSILNNTKYGNALNFSSNGKFIITASGESRNRSFTRVSMMIDDEMRYNNDTFFVYYYTTSSKWLNFSVSGYDQFDSGVCSIHLNATVMTVGWNEFKGDFGCYYHD